MIESFAFGFMVISGTKYSSDLVIYPDGHVEDLWRRKQGHMLSSDDIDRLIKSEPEIIVAGTGVSGLMKPEKRLEKLLNQKGIKFISQPNQKAIQVYNNLCLNNRVGACFHLTC
ncbi:MAG: MTH938/NDUFAF3 family protein [Thermodesulfobacteriota bacterium]|nr:MTH938/NDUFAF3 family protein [Thermodesulfobacteriota bacterium]